jgi:hypothetical protein
VERSQGHCVLPEVLAQFRTRIDSALMDELLALQAAAAMEAGLVSPAQLVVDTFPSEQGSQRVNDAATLYKAKKKSSRSLRPSPSTARARGQRGRLRRNNSSRTSPRSCGALAASAAGRARSL